MQTYDLFDIIGPRMVGPSSSHTAGAARLGRMANKIAGGSKRNTAGRAFHLRRHPHRPRHTQKARPERDRGGVGHGSEIRQRRVSVRDCKDMGTLCVPLFVLLTPALYHISLFRR